MQQPTQFEPKLLRKQECNNQRRPRGHTQDTALRFLTSTESSVQIEVPRLRDHSARQVEAVLLPNIVTPTLNKSRKVMVSNRVLDRCGIGLSVFCVFNCVGLPLITTVSSLGVYAAYAHRPVIMLGATGLAVCVAAWKLIVNELRKRRLVTPIAAVIAAGALSTGTITTVLSSASKNSAERGEAFCGMPPTLSRTPLPSVRSDRAHIMSPMARPRMHLLGPVGAAVLGLLHFRSNIRGGKRGDVRGPCGNAREFCECAD